MVEYVKTCPQCGHLNPEQENVCLSCGHFLGLVPPLPRPEVQSPISQDPAPDVAPDREPAGPERQPQPEQASPEPRLYLESLATGKTFEVRSGFIVGQAHPTSQAQVQLTDLPDLNYVSRNHCQFDLDQGIWYVTALPSALNGTQVNQMVLNPGGRARLRPGDELMMANVAFRIRMID